MEILGANRLGDYGAEKRKASANLPNRERSSRKDKKISRKEKGAKLESEGG